MLLAEELMLTLLAADGALLLRRDVLQQGLAGALLLDLASGGAIALDGRRSERLRRLDGLPTGDALLDDALRRLPAGSRSAHRTVWALAPGSRLAVLARLEGIGAVRRAPVRVLGLSVATRWPPTDGERARLRRSDVAAVLAGDAIPATDTGALAALLDAMRGVPSVVPPGVKGVRNRGPELRDCEWAPEPVRDRFREIVVGVRIAADRVRSG